MASKLQTKTLNYLRKMGRDNVLSYSINASGHSMKGLPDIVAHIYGGRSMFAEIKEPGDRLSGVQKERIRQLKELGFYVDVIRSVDDVKNFVYNVAKGVANAKRQKDDATISRLSV